MRQLCEALLYGFQGLDHGTGHLASMNSQKNQHINDGKG
jgi:hypothetical protein